ncbi:MAG TPA: hypothetical protein VNW50_01615 [Streptosporangiaceae bacterium]|nr:hypothetical protein [Streptosporangiaceae bacterium]
MTGLRKAALVAIGVLVAAASLVSFAESLTGRCWTGPAITG